MVYLDNAATTWPKPRSVLNAMTDSIDKFGANPGRSGHSMSIAATEKIFECRELISDFFSLGNPSNVVFTQNATHALNIVIRGILKKGDHAICTAMDHNSVLRPIFDGLDNVEVSVIEADGAGEIDADSIHKSIRPNTRLVVMTHISNVCGTVMPVEKTAKICRENNIMFLLDASQSAGIIDINIQKLGIDFLATSGHKGLYGPMGTGILCINTDELPTPILLGGTGSNSLELVQPSELPDRYESGTLNLPGICGLCSGIAFVKKYTPENIYRHEMKLAARLLSGLESIDGIKIIGKSGIFGRSGVVSFVSDRFAPSDIASQLDKKYSVAIRSMFHCAGLAHDFLHTKNGGTARISVGIFNTMHDIDYLLYSLNELNRSK